MNLPEAPARTPRSFRSRLLLMTGPALALALAVLVMLAWFAAYGALNYSDYTIMAAEAREVTSQVVEGARLRVDAYHWDEPHHRFATHHIDPIFLQVFDAGGRLLRTSENLAYFASQSYPDRPLPVAESPALLTPFRQMPAFWAGGELMRYQTYPILSAQSAVLGYVQLARFDADHAPLLRRLALALGALFLLMLGGLLGLFGWTAGRVLRPLGTITAAAHTISPQQLNQRVPIPADADRETVLLAKTLNTLLTRLERSFDEMERFTAHAAHELQTPLTVLRGHVEVARRRSRAPEAYQQTLEVLHREINDLIHLVRSLLLLARMDQREQPPETEPVDLAELVRACAPPFQRQAEAKGLVLQFDLPPHAWTTGQPSLLREVVDNLLDNALKYTRRGRVHVQVAAGPSAVRLCVEDTGIGIAPEALPHVTDRFYRAPSADALGPPGSGLGLALVAQIAARHGGDLQIRSAPGEGTEVVLLLSSAAPQNQRG